MILQVPGEVRKITIDGRNGLAKIIMSHASGIKEMAKLILEKDSENRAESLGFVWLDSLVGSGSVVGCHNPCGTGKIIPESLRPIEVSEDISRILKMYFKL